VRVGTAILLLVAGCAPVSPQVRATAASPSSSPPPPAMTTTMTASTTSSRPAPTAAAPGDGGALPLLPRTSALGSDVSELPALHPRADWLAIEAPLLSMELLVRVVANGRTTVATLDTGAQATTMSVPMAQQLGVLDAGQPRGMPVRAIDSHGDVILGERLTIDELAVGNRRWRNVTVTVIGDVPGLFLIGADLLSQVDLYIAADEGLVGLFPAGGAPRDDKDVVVPARRGEQQLVVDGTARGAQAVRFPLLVDTGAWNTSVPVGTGVRAGLPADIHYASTTVGIAGEQDSRGRFVLAPLLLGPGEAPVGRVLAVASSIDRGDGFGLLGNDVFFRFHTVVSFADASLRFRPLIARGNARPRGPGNAPCAGRDDGACVRVALQPTTTPTAPDDLPGLCLDVDIAPAYAGSTVELAITAEVPGEVALFNGGAIRAFVSVAAEGARHCFTLWRQLERLGLNAQTPLQLRWVRTEGVRWPCDPMKTRCITFSGPLARPRPPAAP
jgi:predicted aspartyl protease